MPIAKQVPAELQQLFWPLMGLKMPGTAWKKVLTAGAPKEPDTHWNIATQCACETECVNGGVEVVRR